jgi:osmotically-inducible protein OsmY
VKAPLGVPEISNDSWITTKVKSALLAESELNGVKVKVITEDKEVFLFGYVTEAQAKKATEIARNISGVKQVIRAFEYGNAKTAEQ